ncbi:MAG: putative toxin-antitoxin system toxin component, PIN family [Acidobacteriaceae bacterium]
MTQRVVFDTSVVLSALVFQGGKLAWLRAHWRDGGCVPLVSRDTAEELLGILQRGKFKLTSEEQRELLADYLPYCEIVKITKGCPVQCRDAKDQPFLDLAQSSKAESLVTGDRDLLVLVGRTKFLVETPEEYRRRVRWN